MRCLPTTARIVASWQTCCQCNYARGNTPPGETFSTEPRFNFKREARLYAKHNGMKIIAWNKYKSALAMLPVACPHRDEQHVRLSWELA